LQALMHWYCKAGAMFPSFAKPHPKSQRSCGSINRPWLRNSAESWLPIMVSLRLRHSLPLCMGGRLWFWHVQIPNQPQRDVMTKPVFLFVYFSAVLIL
jgi:hypothetical protein